MTTYADSDLMALQTRAASLLRNRQPSIDAYHLTAAQCAEVITKLAPNEPNPIIERLGIDMGRMFGRESQQ